MYVKGDGVLKEQSAAYAISYGKTVSSRTWYILLYGLLMLCSSTLE